MPRSALPSEAVVDQDDHRADWDRVLALVWAGMVLGISFLATPSKFLAPSLPLPVALDVGRHTFRVFGRVEVALAVLLGLRAAAPVQQRPLSLAPGLIVLAQALWLRPRLDARTQQVVKGQEPPSSRLHLAYVACEVAKLAALLILGLTAARSGMMRGGR
jgi:hypothetical protein